MITQECSALYVHESLSPSILNVTPRTDHVESLSVKIRIGTTPFIVSCIYRQPVSQKISFTKLENVFEQILSHNHSTVIMGDFNIHYNQSPNNKAHDLETIFQVNQLIKNNTRVTDNSSSLIDLIYTNVPHYHTSSGVIPLSLSDHFVIFTSINFKKSNKSNKIHSRISRNFNRFN